MTVKTFLNNIFNKAVAENTHPVEENIVKQAEVKRVEAKPTTKYVQGDIVCATMPLSEEVLSKIEYSHRQRPYVVVSCGEDSVIAYECSSKDKPNLLEARYQINTNRYNVWKDGYVYLNEVKVIPFQNILKKLDTLAKDSMMEMNRIISKQCSDSDRLPFFGDVSISFRRGDIIRSGSTLYYVNDAMRGRYSSYVLHKKNKTGNDLQIMVNDRPLHFSVQDHVEIKNTEKFMLEAVVGKNKKKKIVRALQELRENADNAIPAGAIA